MKAVGIIAEYNPFHNGHAYHLSKAKELARADYAIVIMSGDFVQRGEPAVFNKYIRTKMALLGDADLILELPVRYACGSAEYFASGAVRLLDSLGIADTLCFGSEYEDVDDLMCIAGILSEEPEAYRIQLRQNLACGHSYPLAMSKALEQYAKDRSVALKHPVSALLSSPNSRLGIEYCRALIRLHSDITPAAIRRIGSGYHQTELSGDFSSASAIRNAIRQDSFDISKSSDTNGNLPADSLSDTLAAQIPAFCQPLFKEALKENVAAPDDYSLLLKYKLMQETADSLTSYLDVSPELANRIYSNLNAFSSFDAFVQTLKTKELTYNRISRALLHVLLNIRDFDLQNSLQTPAPYARILGFRKSASCLLHAIKENKTVRLISKAADYASVLDGSSRAFFEQDLWCGNLYESVAAAKTCRLPINELSRPILFL